MGAPAHAASQSLLCSQVEVPPVDLNDQEPQAVVESGEHQQNENHEEEAGAAAARWGPRLGSRGSFHEVLFHGDVTPSGCPARSRVLATRCHPFRTHEV